MRVTISTYYTLLPVLLLDSHLFLAFVIIPLIHHVRLPCLSAELY